MRSDTEPFQRRVLPRRLFARSIADSFSTPGALATATKGAIGPLSPHRPVDKRSQLRPQRTNCDDKSDLSERKPSSDPRNQPELADADVDPVTQSSHPLLSREYRLHTVSSVARRADMYSLHPTRRSSLTRCLHGQPCLLTKFHQIKTYNRVQTSPLATNTKVTSHVIRQSRLITSFGNRPERDLIATPASRLRKGGLCIVVTLCACAFVMRADGLNDVALTQYCFEVKQVTYAKMSALDRFADALEQAPQHARRAIATPLAAHSGANQKVADVITRTAISPQGTWLRHRRSCDHHRCHMRKYQVPSCLPSLHRPLARSVIGTPSEQNTPSHDVSSIRYHIGQSTHDGDSDLQQIVSQQSGPRRLRKRQHVHGACLMHSINSLLAHEYRARAQQRPFAACSASHQISHNIRHVHASKLPARPKVERNLRAGSQLFHPKNVWKIFEQLETRSSSIVGARSDSRCGVASFNVQAMIMSRDLLDDVTVIVSGRDCIARFDQRMTHKTNACALCQPCTNSSLERLGPIRTTTISSQGLMAKELSAPAHNCPLVQAHCGVRHAVAYFLRKQGCRPLVHHGAPPQILSRCPARSQGVQHDVIQSRVLPSRASLKRWGQSSPAHKLFAGMRPQNCKEMICDKDPDRFCRVMTSCELYTLLFLNQSCMISHPFAEACFQAKSAIIAATSAKSGEGLSERLDSRKQRQGTDAPRSSYRKHLIAPTVASVRCCGREDSARRSCGRYRHGHAQLSSASKRGPFESLSEVIRRAAGTSQQDRESKLSTDNTAKRKSIAAGAHYVHSSTIGPRTPRNDPNSAQEPHAYVVARSARTSSDHRWRASKTIATSTPVESLAPMRSPLVPRKGACRMGREEERMSLNLPTSEESCTVRYVQDVDGARKLRFKVSIYAIFGGGEELGNSAGSWETLRQMWSGPLVSIGPVSTSVRHGFTIINQLVALLLFPAMLTDGAPKHTIAGGWSLGCTAAQVLATLCSMSIAPLCALFILDARTRNPLEPKGGISSSTYPRQFLWTDWHSNWDWRPVRGSHTDQWMAFQARRDPVGVASAFPRMRDATSLLEIRSWILRTEGMSWFLQVDHETLERGDIYSSAVGTGIWFPDTDHFLLGIQNAWDIARVLRGSAMSKYD